MTNGYTIPMDRLFANQSTYGDMDLQSRQSREETDRLNELARSEFLKNIPLPFKQSLLTEFAPAETENIQFTQNAEPYSALSVKQAPPSIVGGMFSPEISRAAEMEYLQKRQADMRDRALAFAQLSPMQQADYGFYRGGQQLGDVVGGALGGQDPQLRMIGLQQQILSELDPSDPEQQLRVAQKYAQTAPELAMKIAESARKSMSEMALTTQRLREKQGADPFEQLLRSGKYTPSSMATYKVSGNVADLREVESPDKVPADIQKARLVAQSKGFKEGTKEYNDELVKQLEKTDKRPTEEIFDLMAELDVLDPVKDKKKYDIVQARIDKLTKGKSLEESLGEGLGMLGKALAAGQKKEAEETGKYTAENFKNLGSAVAAGTASKRNIATLETSLENAFTGKFAEGKEAVVGALISLGIPVGSDLKNATSNTQLIQAMGTRYIFPLVKNYPGSLAAKELASLEKTAPNALQQPETIKRLVGLLKVDLAENEYTYNRAKEYKKANKESLIGFNEADQRIEFQNKLGRLQELVTNVKRKKSKTPQEDAEINQLKKELYIGG